VVFDLEKCMSVLPPCALQVIAGGSQRCSSCCWQKCKRSWVWCALHTPAPWLRYMVNHQSQLRSTSCTDPAEVLNLIMHWQTLAGLPPEPVVNYAAFARLYWLWCVLPAESAQRKA
jgi:hypothetical protein